MAKRGKPPKNRGKQTNRGNAITSKKREEMFQVFFKNGSVNSVVKLCNIHNTTARKYRLKDNWDKRVETIRKKAVEKSDDKNAKRIADNLKLVDYTKTQLMKDIQKEGVESTRKASDLDKLIRLELLLIGDVAAKGEIIIKLPDGYEDL